MGGGLKEFDGWGFKQYVLEPFLKMTGKTAKNAPIFMMISIQIYIPSSINKKTFFFFLNLYILPCLFLNQTHIIYIYIYIYIYKMCVCVIGI